MRFRLGEFAVLCDIEQMLHQVEVKKTDRDALRFYRGNHLAKLSLITR